LKIIENCVLKSISLKERERDSLSVSFYYMITKN